MDDAAPKKVKAARPAATIQERAGSLPGKTDRAGSSLFGSMSSAEGCCGRRPEELAKSAPLPPAGWPCLPRHQGDAQSNRGIPAPQMRGLDGLRVPRGRLERVLVAGTQGVVLVLVPQVHQAEGLLDHQGRSVTAVSTALFEWSG